jgi:hypothetical protein
MRARETLLSLFVGVAVLGALAVGEARVRAVDTRAASSGSASGDPRYSALLAGDDAAAHIADSPRSSDGPPPCHVASHITLDSPSLLDGAATSAFAPSTPKHPLYLRHRVLLL